MDGLNEARAEQLNRVKITEKEVEALEGAKAEAEALQVRVYVCFGGLKGMCLGKNVRLVAGCRLGICTYARVCTRVCMCVRKKERDTRHELTTLKSRQNAPN